MKAAHSTSVLKKTALARTALETGSRLLSPRERTLVLLADGQRSVPDLCHMVHGASESFVQALVEKGFLEPVDGDRNAERASSRTSNHTSTRDQGTEQPNTLIEQRPAQPRLGAVDARNLHRQDAGHIEAANSGPAPWVDALGVIPTPRAVSVGLRRSAAATKMHLIDLAERTFSRGQPERSAYFRDMLREIRDDESLLLAIDIVLEAVAEVAGEDRAQAMRDHLLEPREPF